MISPLTVTHLVLVIVLLAAAVNAQNTNPFDLSNGEDDRQSPAASVTEDSEDNPKPAKANKADRKQKGQEAIRKNADSRAAQLHDASEKDKELLFRLAAHLPAAMHREVKQNFEKMRDEQAILSETVYVHESQVLVVQTELDELKAWYDKQRKDVNDKLNAQSQKADEAEHELHLANQSLAEIQTWFAHAVQSVEQPDVQRWVLARLKSHGEILRHLVNAAHRGVAATETRKDCQLESELKRVSSLELSPISIAASEVLHLIEQDFSKNQMPPPWSTLPWPIVTQVGREAEQDLLTRINGQQEFYFVEVEISEFLKYCEDLLEISIEIDESAKQLLAAKGDIFIDLDKKYRSFRSALELVLPTHELTYQIRDGSCVITTIENAKANPIRRAYMIWDQADTETIVKALAEAMDGADLKIIRVADTLVAVGTEQSHYELSKLLALMYQARFPFDDPFE